jgi:hypothetical protein
MKKFKVIDVSGDIGLKAFGKSINEVFVNAAIGMYSLITNLSTIKKVNMNIKKSIAIPASININFHSFSVELNEWFTFLISAGSCSLFFLTSEF